MPESMTATPMPLPVIARLDEQAEQPARAGPDLVGARDLVGDGHVGDDRQVTRDVRDAAVGDEPARRSVRAEIEREGAGELTPEPPAVARAQRLERALLRLHDHAHARSARQGRFQVFRERRALLPCRVSRRQHEADEQSDKQESSDASMTPPLEDTSSSVQTRGSSPNSRARSGPGQHSAMSEGAELWG